MFQVNKYLGEWSEVAFVPSWFEWACVGKNTTATYALDADGTTMLVTNRTEVWGVPWVARGAATVRGEGKFAVSFYGAPPPSKPNYVVAAVGGKRNEYVWSVVRGPSGLAWVLVRRHYALSKKDMDAIQEALLRTGGVPSGLVFRTNDDDLEVRTNAFTLQKRLFGNGR
jgi:lipocalin